MDGVNASSLTFVLPKKHVFSWQSVHIGEPLTVIRTEISVLELFQYQMNPLHKVDKLENSYIWALPLVLRDPGEHLLADR